MATPVPTGSFVTGLFRVFEAGERLLVEQAELLRLDSRARIGALAARFGLGALGGLCMFTAWLGFLAAAVVAFDGVPLGARLALAALAQLLVGIAFLAAARRGEDNREDDGDD